MVWFKKKNKFTTISNKKKKDLPEGVWRVCESCQQYVTNEEIRRNHYICTLCNHYYVMPVEDRIRLILDQNSFEEFDAQLASRNPLDFEGYEGKLQRAQSKTNRNEAVVTGRGTVHEMPVIFGALDFSFMGGSMGSVVGEKITRAAERALNDDIPLVVVSTGGGGARMQEGMISLMQMAKTSAAISRLKQHRIPYISIICHPTMGGVAASFAALGDIILAEPGALIGFAGPRVIEQTIGQRLPEGFQTAEFLIEHGMIDSIVNRTEIRSTLKPLLNHLWLNPKMAAWSKTQPQEETGTHVYAVKK